MAQDREKDPGVADRKGSFTDSPDQLLPLFSDPDGRGDRRWREVFGHERPKPKATGPFILREVRKSSSGS
jgi:hypothetical protein